MHTVEQMLSSHPQHSGDAGELARTVQALLACAQACTACADACLGEERVADLVTCIGLDLDCADICAATARVLSRQTAHGAELTRALLEACATACRGCGEECARHADMHEHCRVCAEACTACEEACRALL